MLQQREKELQSRIEQLQVREGGKTLLTARSLTIEVYISDDAICDYVAGAARQRVEVQTGSHRTNGKGKLKSGIIIAIPAMHTMAT